MTQIKCARLLTSNDTPRSHRFIDKYILCPVCKLPETYLHVKKSAIRCLCNSCGKTSKLDSIHKLAVHICKHPPANESEFKGKEVKKEAKKLSKDAKADGETRPKKAKPVSTGVTIQPEHLTLVSPDIVELISRIRAFRSAQSRTSNELLGEIENLCATQGFKEGTKYYIVLCSLFNGNMLQQWTVEPCLREALKLLIDRDAKKGQYWLLLALQHLVLKLHPTELKPATNTILKFFYDADLLEEDVLLEHFADPVDGEEKKSSDILASALTYNPELNAEFKQQAQGFLQWLR